MNIPRTFDTFESLPDILTAKHIASYLHVSGRAVYELFHVGIDAGGIPSFVFGGCIRVQKERFSEWLNNRSCGNFTGK